MKRNIPWANLAIVSIAIAFWIVSGSMLVKFAQQHDFLSLYTGGTIFNEGSASRLYDVDLQRRIENRVQPEATELDPFPRPPLCALMMSFFARLPFMPAYWTWTIGQISALIGVWVWAARRFGSDALVYCSFFLPAAYGITHAQDNVWMLLVILTSFVLLERENEIGAGAILALGLVKFHLLLLFPVVLALQRRWRMLMVFCALGTVEAAASVAVLGRSGVSKYWELLHRDDLLVNPVPWMMYHVQAVPLNFGLSLWFSAPLILLVVSLMVVTARRGPLWRWYAAAVIGSLLVAPHAYRYDATMLLPSILFAIFASTSKLTRIVAATAVIPIPYLIALIGPPIAILPVLLFLTFLFALARESYLEARAGEHLPQTVPVPA